MMTMVKKTLKSNDSTATRLLSIIPQLLPAPAVANFPPLPTPVIPNFPPLPTPLVPKFSPLLENYLQPPHEKYKSVFLTALPRNSITRDWMVINPNCHAEGDDDCKFTLQQMYSDTTPLGTRQFGSASCDSKSYFAGGEYLEKKSDSLNYSNKVFTYHHNTQTLELALPSLNIARWKPQVAVVGNVIYVVGGRGCGQYSYSDALTPDTWIECYDLNNNNNNNAWKYLASPVPKGLISLVYQSGTIFSSAVYELGSQILFFVPIYRKCSGRTLAIYSFNYASTTWDDVIEMNLHMTNDSSVAIVQHILFLPTPTAICAYDLSKRLLLFKHSLEALTCPCEECWNRKETLHLFHVGKDTLLLLCHHGGCDIIGVGPQLTCYKYRIEYSSEDHSRPTSLCLDGSHCFPLKHRYYDIESLML